MRAELSSDGSVSYKSENKEYSNAVTSLSGSKSFGHLLSSNNNTLKKGKVSIGTLYAGVGITDNITVAVSPFIWQQFKMYNGYIRSGFKISKNEDIGVDVGYFKTMKENSYNSEKIYYCPEDQPDLFTCSSEVYNYKERSNFEMQAWATKITYGKKINSFYKSNITLSYFYFSNDYEPFSFRMDPQNGDNFSLNLTSLHELRLTEKFYINYEIGGWGLNYAYPYIHGGTTVNWQHENFFAGLGFSATFSPWFPDNKIKEFHGGYDSRMSVHPELQVQMFF